MTCGRRARLLLGCLAALFSFTAAAAKEPVVGASAPTFRVTTFDGKKLTLADFKGQVLVVNFWATWCAPCKEELPLLDKYYRARENVGLRILAVTTEDSVPQYQLKKLAAALAIPMVRQFRGDYGPLKAVPTNYVIDRAGVLRYAKAAALTLDDLNEILIPLLREAAPVTN
jgi:cytochrome c biogenesis protein CcmG/thiol:disulfide interchange protein DsbE